MRIALLGVGVLFGCGDGKKLPVAADGAVDDADVDAPPLDAAPDAGLPEVPPLPAHCTGTLTGNVSVTNSLQLDQIKNYTTVTGNITINVPGLTTVDLTCLQHVGGTLRVYDTDDVVDIRLTHLEDADTLLLRSAALQQIDLQSLTSVATRARLAAQQVVVPRFANAGVLSISGGAVALPSLVQVGAFGIDATHPVSAPLLQTIGSLLIGHSVGSVTTLSFPAATSIAGDLTIDAAIQTLHMPALVSVGGRVFVEHAANLVSLSGLSAVTTTHGIATCFAPKLASLGMTSLTRIQGNLDIGEHTWSVGVGISQSCSNGAPMLSALNLPALTKVDGRVYLYATALPNVNSLANLTAIDGHLRVEQNAQLPTLAALGNLASVGDQVIIRNNPALTTLGLGALRSVSALCPCGAGTFFPGFHVDNNPQLPTCDAVDIYNGLTINKPEMQYATFVNNQAPTTCP